MIRISNLKKIFRSEEVETVALHNINLHIREGEFVAITGPSGSGKSTLLNIAGLLDSPSQGSYILDDREVGHLNKKERFSIRKGKIGIVFQHANLIDDMTVYENVELPLIYQHIKADERKKRVHDIILRTDMGYRAYHYPNQLSGVEQQRIAIARAAVIDPLFILADEPTGNLDSVNGAMIMKLLKEINEAGCTIVMATHSQHDALYAQRIFNLFDGQILGKTK